MKFINIVLKKNLNFNFSIKFNVFLFLLIINFIAYSIYAVLSKYNIFIIEALINLNFIIFFLFYKKYPEDKISFNLKLDKQEILFFIFLFIFLFVLLFDELRVPLFGDEIAPTRRAIRTPLFASYIILNILNMDYLKEIPFKYVIQILGFLQILFIIFSIYLLKSKKLGLFILLLTINFILRIIVKDAVHHPPLNHIFSTALIPVLGFNHMIVRISYFLPFMFFLIILFKLITEHIDKKSSMLLIFSISTFPFLAIASVVPDHSLWASLTFTVLLFYVYVKKDIDYRLCFLAISIGILFRITIFSGFILIGLVFISDFFNKRFLILQKIKQLLLKEKIFVFILIFIPLFLISIAGNVNFEGVNNLDSLNLFYEALKSKIIFKSLIKQIPVWYYAFIFLIFFTVKKIEFFVFFILNLVIYFSINPYFWGNAKYVLEYGVPFFIFGHFVFTKLLIEKKKFWIVNIANLIIVLLNINDIQKFPESRLSSDLIYKKGYQQSLKSSDKRTKYLLKIPYNYDDAFQYIKKIDGNDNTLLLGTTYGFLPQILENYNFNELKAVINLRNNFDNLNNVNYSLSKKIVKLNSEKNLFKLIKEYLQSMKDNQIIGGNEVDKNNNDLKNEFEEHDPFLKINDIKNLEYILITDFGIRAKVTMSLISKNWKLEKKFEEPNYRSTLLLFKKY
jgi:hypothetical protein